MDASCDEAYQKEVAFWVLSLLDLTLLNDHDTESDIASLLGTLEGLGGVPASFCTWPGLAAAARSFLEEHGLEGVSVTTVANFPSGSDDIVRAEEDVAYAVSVGADEIDVVFPWSALTKGNQRCGEQLVERCRAIAGPRLLKVILETGCLADSNLMRRAAEISIESGADFLKTSTGKAPIHATPEGADVLLRVIQDRKKPVGFKASGGIGTLEDACLYLQKAKDIMGNEWITPKTFRFGASRLLDDIRRVLSEREGGSLLVSDVRRYVVDGK